jgi:hypothetical protein
MGSNEVIEVVTTDEDAQDAFRRVSQENLQEYGYRYDNGHLGGYGCKIYDGKMRSEQAARKIAYEHFDRGMEKGGTTIAVELGEPTITSVKTVVKTLHLSRADLAKYESTGEAIQAEAVLQAPTQDPANLFAWEVVGAKQDPYGIGEVEYRFRQRTVATEGPKQTRYFVQRVGYEAAREWKDGHLTQAAAKAALQQMLTTATRPRLGESVTRYGIHAETRRESGEPLTIIENEVVGLHVQIGYSILKRGATVKHTGWLFFANVPS